MEPLEVDAHCSALFEAYARDLQGGMWTYLPYGPFSTEVALAEWIRAMRMRADPQFYAIVKKETGKAVGAASYLRIDPSNGCIEVGHLSFSPDLQRTVVATEAMYLMMNRAFSLGYRRYEWKCNVLNLPSRRAAARLGFSFEGVFRQAVVARGRNRDTAWYAVLDADWPRLSEAFKTWLDAANFGSDGKQKLSLSALTLPHRSNFLETELRKEIELE